MRALTRLVAAILLIAPRAVFANGQEANDATKPSQRPAPPATSASDRAAQANEPAIDPARLAERDRLAKEAQQLRAEEKLVEAIAKFEEVITLERDLFGNDHDEVVGSLQQIAVWHEEAKDFAAAKQALQDVLEKKTKRLGNDNWQVVDASRALADVELRSKLTPDQRRGLANATDANRKFLKLYQQGRFAEAAPLAIKALSLRKEVLGENHSHYAQSLNNLAALYKAQSDYARASALYEQALAINKNVLGEDHPDYALSLNNLAKLYQAQGDYTRALPLVEQALAINKKVLGENHPNYATSLSNLANLYQDQGDYAQALPLYERALAHRKEILGENHPEYALSLSDLAALYYARGDFALALPLLEQALAIRKKVLGENHPDYAVSLNNLAALFDVQGDYERARPLYVQALAINKKVLGENHPDYALSLNNLAYFYSSRGDYARARPLYEQALAINKKVLGQNHPDYARSLNNLARLYQDQGDYARAHRLYVQALAINKKLLGEYHPAYATSLNNLAGLYQDQGDYAQALPLYEQALAHRKEILGENHPNYATSLSDLAYFYSSQGDYARARPLCEQALAITKEALGENHPDYALSLNNLAVLYNVQGDFAQALPLFEQVLATRKKVLGENHPDYALSLNNLAVLYQDQGDYPQALPLYEKALAIRKKVLGENHPDYAQSLNNLAGLYQDQGDFARAHPLIEQAVQVMSAHVELAAAAQSERQQLAMADKSKSYVSNFLSYIFLSGGDAQQSYSLVISWKGTVFARQQWLRRGKTADEPADVQEMVDNLRSVAGRLATLALAKPGPEQHAVWRRQLAELTQERESIEAELSRRSAEFRRLEAKSNLTSAQLRGTLPPEAALVDLFEYSRRAVEKQEAGPYKQRRQQRVAAFVVGADKSVVAIDLGLAEPIHVAVDAWREQISQSGGNNSAGQELRRLVWEPLATHLEGVTTVLISPDGQLASIPWAALPGSKPESYLIEERAIAVVAVPQLISEILQQANDSARPSLCVLGDVDYGASPGQATLLPDSRSATREYGDREGVRKNRPPLDATQPEIADIEATFQKAFQPAQVTELRAASATEEGFRQQAGKHRFLHLATHGFFAPPEIRSALAPDKTRDGALGHSDLFGERDVVGFHPGLLSGIVLAGANLPPDPEKDDGILTALEVGALDLRNVELVTLSACETGLGQVAGGEGILGLQRAFQIAGARTTVASLWKVDDDATRALMSEFYRNLWEKKLPRIEALRQAQLTMLNEYDRKAGKLRGSGGTVDIDPDDLASNREADAETAGQRTPPFYWAAFVLSGDWQ